MDYVRDEPEKMIRNKKVNKNRNEKNKIRALLDSIVLKNKEEAKIKALLDGTKWWSYPTLSNLLLTIKNTESLAEGEIHLSLIELD